MSRFLKHDNNLNALSMLHKSSQENIVCAHDMKSRM